MASAEAVAAVVEAPGRARRRGCWRRVEERLRAIARRPGPPLGGHARRDDRGRRQAAAAAAGLRSPPGRRGATAPALVRGAWPSSSCTPRRSSTTTCWTPRRCAAGARRSWRRPGRDLAAATGDLLFARAFAELAAQRRDEPVRALGRRSALAAGRAAAARGRVGRAACAWSATCAAASSRPRGCSRPRAGSARWQAAATVDALGAFGRGIGLAFQMLDDVLDVSGPAERTGKHRGTDLLDGTVTLPFILARERDPSLRGSTALDPEQAEAVCDRIAATGALDEARARPWTVAEAKASLPAGCRPRRARAGSRGRQRRRALHLTVKAVARSLRATSAAHIGGGTRLPGWGATARSPRGGSGRGRAPR